MQSQVCNISGDMQNLSKCPRHASCRVLIEASKTLHDLTPLSYNIIILPPSLASLGFYNAPNLFLGTFALALPFAWNSLLCKYVFPPTPPHHSSKRPPLTTQPSRAFSPSPATLSRHHPLFSSSPLPATPPSLLVTVSC